MADDKLHQLTFAGEIITLYLIVKSQIIAGQYKNH